MKFWKSIRGLGSLDKGNGNDRKKGKKGNEASSNIRRQNNNNNQHYYYWDSGGGGGGSNEYDVDDSLYEEFRMAAATASRSPSQSSTCSTLSLETAAADNQAPLYGTTFVELIKRRGTRLGVEVTEGGKISAGICASSDAATAALPKISSLSVGSWAQRSDVLCVGDSVVSVNGADAGAMSLAQMAQALEVADRVQLEVRYPLPSPGRARNTRQKVIQVTLRKQAGSFGMVIRGGLHEKRRLRRPFVVAHVTPNGAASCAGVIRVGDRIRAINGATLRGMKLPELQALIYRQEGDTVFTVEYDVAEHRLMERSRGSWSRGSQGPLLVEIRREGPDDILGFGLNKIGHSHTPGATNGGVNASDSSGHIYVESVRQASLADRCGAIHVGDLLLAVDGTPVRSLSPEEATETVRSGSCIVRLEILPGIFSRGNHYYYRSSMPSSPCSSSLSRPYLNKSVRSRARCQRYLSMTEIDRRLGGGDHVCPRHLSPHSPLPSSMRGEGSRRQLPQRNKSVSFTVELQRDSDDDDDDDESDVDGGALGLTLATTAPDASHPGPIFVSALAPGGLAERTGTLRVGDQLVEVDGKEVRDLSLAQVIPLLQQQPSPKSGGVCVTKLKLSRLISIPERDFAATLGRRRRRPDQGDGEDIYSHYCCRKPPLPRSLPPNGGGSQRNSSRRDSTSSSVATTVTTGGGGDPVEIHRVTLFKDPIYEDFGFSVSDGLRRRGVFVAGVRRGGPADGGGGGLLRPLDRVLRIGDARAEDLDCCLAVPLIAAAGDKVELTVARAASAAAAAAVAAVVQPPLASDEEYDDDEGGGGDSDSTLTGRRQRRGGGGCCSRRTGRNAASNSHQRLPRTNSADGRLMALSSGGGGSLTGEVMPFRSATTAAAAAEFTPNEGDAAL